MKLSRIEDISSSVICFWVGLFISALANILNVLALTPALLPEGPGGAIDGPALDRGLTRGAEDLAAEVPERAVAGCDLKIETAGVVLFFTIWGLGCGLARMLPDCLESQEVALSFLSMVISRSEATASVEEGTLTAL